jgi:hypothetical protein
MAKANLTQRETAVSIHRGHPNSAFKKLDLLMEGWEKHKKDTPILLRYPNMTDEQFNKVVYGEESGIDWLEWVRVR